MIECVQIWFGETIPPRNMACIDQVRGMAEQHGAKYELIRLPAVAEPWGESDLLRIKLGAERPYMWYLDCDMELTGWLTPTGNLPYLTQYARGQVHCDSFYVNGRCDIFRRMLRDYVRRGLHPCYGLQAKLSRDLDRLEGCHTIPDGVIKHHFFTLKNGGYAHA